MLLNLTNTDKKAIIDDKHFGLVKLYTWRWKQCGANSYYVATSIRVNKKWTTLYLHRLIMQPQPGMDVHHKNTNSLDNQEENLEEREAMFHRSWHNQTRCIKNGQT